MSRPLRAVTAGAFLQLGLAAILLATHGLPQPQVQAGVSNNLSSTHLPLASMVVITLSFGLGWCFILTGAQQVHWGLRLLVTALVTIALGFFPVFKLIRDSSLEGRPFAQEVGLAWIQLGILSLLWAWSIGALLIERRRPVEQSRKAAQTHRGCHCQDSTAILHTETGVQPRSPSGVLRAHLRQVPSDGCGTQVCTRLVGTTTIRYYWRTHKRRPTIVSQVPRAVLLTFTMLLLGYGLAAAHR
jgi:hypothetical protein